MVRKFYRFSLWLCYPAAGEGHMAKTTIAVYLDESMAKKVGRVAKKNRWSISKAAAILIERAVNLELNK